MDKREALPSGKGTKSLGSVGEQGESADFSKDSRPTYATILEGDELEGDEVEEADPGNPDTEYKTTGWKHARNRSAVRRAYSSATPGIGEDISESDDEVVEFQARSVLASRVISPAAAAASSDLKDCSVSSSTAAAAPSRGFVSKNSPTTMIRSIESDDDLYEDGENQERSAQPRSFLNLLRQRNKTKEDELGQQPFTRC
jgi:hypothetical protein